MLAKRICIAYWGKVAACCGKVGGFWMLGSERIFTILMISEKFFIIISENFVISRFDACEDNFDIAYQGKVGVFYP